MPWIAGIDEAGYGPNLGPFVMSLVLLETTRPIPSHLLWSRLKTYIRRADGTVDGRLVVDDSKAVYKARDDLSALEANLGPFLHCLEEFREGPGSVDGLWDRVCLSPRTEFMDEVWYGPSRAILSAVDPAQVLRLTAGLAASGLRVRAMKSVVVFANRFNDLTRSEGSKAAVSAWAIQQLLAQLFSICTTGSGDLSIDKQGGRHFYLPLLSRCLSDTFVATSAETPRASIYQVLHPENPWTIRFEAKAEARYMAVALASMLSKYLRELLMEQFNAFWAERVTGLKPTAGYPGDARRFYDDIADVRQALNIPHSVLWREK
jgi:hypothetical protein